MLGTLELTSSTASAHMPVLTAHEKSFCKFSVMNTFSVFRLSAPVFLGREQAKELIEDLLDSIKDRPENVADMPPYFWAALYSSRERVNLRRTSSMASNV